MLGLLGAAITSGWKKEEERKKTKERNQSRSFSDIFLEFHQ